MLGAISGILGGVVTGVTDYFKGKQEIKKAKLEGEIAILKAEANAKIAISEAKIAMAKQGQINDYNLDMIAMKNMEKSYKDEFLLLLFSFPMVMAFVPDYSDEALKGFEVISKMPEWYQYTFIGMIVVIYGMRGMLTKILDGKKLGLGKSKATVKKAVAENKPKAKGIVIHCSDSHQGRGDDASTIDKWHKERGFKTTCNGKTYHIGYHYVILEDGTIQTGRPLGCKGAHARGYNDYVGICLIGEDSFTDSQYKSLTKLIKGFDVDPKKVIGHYKVSNKTCPNFSVEEFKKKNNI